jgi:hypothetical protein
MKAIPLDEVTQNAASDLKLLDALVLAAQALKSPSRLLVEAALLQQVGCCAVVIKRWEEAAEEMDYPAGASA